MNYQSDVKGVSSRTGYDRAISIMLWLAVLTCWLVSIFSVVQEMCLASACKDTINFTIFGFNLGWFGIVNFSVTLVFLWLRIKISWLNWALSAIVFSGIGAELRLLWIQKYVIGGWCPLCVTICCALFIAAMMLVLEKVQGKGVGQGKWIGFRVWMAFVASMIVIGLTIAVYGVYALT